MDNSVVYKLSYGLYVLTAKDNKDNGCIINTAQQVTTSPNRIAVTVNKSNLTHDMIMNTAKFNLSILSVKAPFDIFKHFGFQSGKETNKFENMNECDTAENGIKYITDYANGYISCSVMHSIDLGTHTMFIGDVIEGKNLSDDASMTYELYHKNVKPKPQVKKSEKTKWVCKICGYVYEGDELPDDFICPICKHGKADFEKVN